MPHFTDEETGAQGREVTCQNLTTDEGPSYGMNPSSLPSALALLLDRGWEMSDP